MWAAMSAVKEMFTEAKSNQNEFDELISGYRYDSEVERLMHFWAHVVLSVICVDTASTAFPALVCQTKCY